MNTHNKIVEALFVLRPNAEWVLRGDDYAKIEWLDKVQTAPTWEEIEAEMKNPTPKPQLTIEDKLSIVGLNLTDLKSALGLE